jgi:hypothetical protein
MTINESSDIEVGQFYKSCNGYYYVGIQYGNTNRLCVVNLKPTEISDSKTPLFPDKKEMYNDWGFSECSQDEVMEYCL